MMRTEWAYSLRFNGRIQNLHLRNVRVSGGAFDVGGLVGYSEDARYENLSVTGGSVNSWSASIVGGLVGYGERANIRYASVSDVDVFGIQGVGGLVGQGTASDIHYAGVSGGSVIGSSSYVGGLVAYSSYANIRYAYVSDVNVSGGGSYVGGLVGWERYAGIRHASVSGGSVTGTYQVGGLLGHGRRGVKFIILMPPRACFGSRFWYWWLDRRDRRRQDSPSVLPIGILKPSGSQLLVTVVLVRARPQQHYNHRPASRGSMLPGVTFGATRTPARKWKAFPNRSASSAFGISAPIPNTRL